MRLHPLSPPVFPATWASEWGEDQYGLWMAFSYQGNRHAFRWIPPGSFMMGSPKSKEGRFDEREAQRKVTFEEGFWLGEFPVTQGLYMAVIGSNPSKFKGSSNYENLPVENVYLKDTVQFIKALNMLHPELTTCLPLESQWEYACRAGTSTRFWFGEHIDLVHANFSGLQATIGGLHSKEALKQPNSKGRYSPNLWGLFDMHGNVWERCLDPWRRSLEDKLVSLDLVRPLLSHLQDNARRVAEYPLRGGTWDSDGQYCHSSYSFKAGPYVRSGLIGFRLTIVPEIQ